MKPLQPVKFPIQRDFFKGGKSGPISYLFLDRTKQKQKKKLSVNQIGRGKYFITKKRKENLTSITSYLFRFFRLIPELFGFFCLVFVV